MDAADCLPFVPTPSPILQPLCPGWVCPQAGLCPATGCQAGAPGWVQPRGGTARGQERAGGVIFQLLPTRGGVLWTAPFLVTVPLLCPFGVVMVPTESPVGSLSPEHTRAHDPFLKTLPPQTVPTTASFSADTVPGRQHETSRCGQLLTSKALLGLPGQQCQVQSL